MPPPQLRPRSARALTKQEENEVSRENDSLPIMRIGARNDSIGYFRKRSAPLRKSIRMVPLWTSVVMRQSAKTWAQAVLPRGNTTR
jgi:hypothetical protein